MVDRGYLEGRIWGTLLLLGHTCLKLLQGHILVLQSEEEIRIKHTRFCTWPERPPPYLPSLTLSSPFNSSEQAKLKTIGSLRKGNTFFHLILTTRRRKNFKPHFTKVQKGYANWLRSHSKLVGWDLGFKSIILATSCSHLFTQQTFMDSRSCRSRGCSWGQDKLSERLLLPVWIIEERKQSISYPLGKYLPVSPKSLVTGPSRPL